MSTLDLCLDHVAVVVDDLDRAAVTYAKMGFHLSPRSSHKGRSRPGGAVELWGTGNHCAMFHTGYFEILGITDAKLKKDQVQSLLDVYAGLHLIALGCDDAGAAAKTLRDRLGENPDPYEVGRDVPLVAGGTAPGKFNILHLADGAFPEADLFCIEHLTREVLWRPDTLDQPNGVVGLANVMVCATDCPGAVARLAKITDVKPVDEGGAWSFDLAPGKIIILDEQCLTSRFPGVVPPALPWVAGCRFVVSDCGATRDYLVHNGFHPKGRDENEFWISPDEAMGAIVVFSNASVSTP